MEMARKLWIERDEWIMPKRVAGFASTMVSMTLAIGGVARMRTRALYALVGERLTKQDWRRKVRLSDSSEAVKEVLFWPENFDRFNGRPIQELGRDAEVDVTGSSDASDVGFGGFVKVQQGHQEVMVKEMMARAEKEGVTASMKECVGEMARTGIEFRGEFTEEQKARSSTWREGHGVKKLLEFAAPLVKGCRVKLNVDNLSLTAQLYCFCPAFREVLPVQT